MLAVAISFFVVAVALAVLLVRTTSRLQAVTADLGEATRGRDAAEAARRIAEAEAADARRQRDDALERASRARRDSADVAKRMKQEADARAAAEVARAAAEVALAEAEASATGSDDQAAELWSLALAAVRRTWEVSVAPSPGLSCPLDGSEDQLRDAIAIEVDAAREEAGAGVELVWSGTDVAAPAVAVRALALAQELIGRLAKATDAAVLHVTSGPQRVVLEVTATRIGGGPAPVDALFADVAPEHQVAPGRFELET